MDFLNKIIWITGASSGIGEALVYELNKLNAKLIISSRRKKELQRVASNCTKKNKPYILPLDLEKNNELALKANEAISAFGKIDILINNGGVGQEGLAINNTLEVEKKVMNINFFGNIELTRRVIPNMKKNGYGKIVVISSILGKLGLPGLGIYSASKHALHGYYEGLRQEVKSSGINVLIIKPGFIKTSVSENSLKSDGSISGRQSSAQKNGMPADICAKKIIKAIKRNIEHVYISRYEHWVVYFKLIAPRFFYWLYNKFAPKKS